MTSTICAAAGGASSQMKRRLVAAAFVCCNKFMRGALTFFERNVGVGETNPNEERHNARDGFEFPDFDVVMRCAGAGSNQELLHAVIADSAHDPDTVIARTFLVRRLLAQDFGAIAAFHEFAESRLGNHIWCFYFPVHDCDHTSLFSRRRITMPTMGITNIRKYINKTQDILLRF